MKLQLFLVSPLSAVIMAACGGSEPAAAPPATPAASPASANMTSASSTTPTAASPACGVTLSGARWDATCQPALDQTCCADEKACAADTGCKSLVDCISACAQKTGKELEACAAKCTPNGTKTPGYPLFDRLGTCSKQMKAPQGARCDWP